MTNRKNPDPHNEIQKPPRLAVWLLEKFCPQHLLEEMQGDIEELFRERLETAGEKEASKRYIRDVVSVINPFRQKRRPELKQYQPKIFPKASLISFDMLRHFLLLSFRNTKKFKGSFFINLIGLSTGLACVILIFLWVNNELSIDKYNENDNRLYQVMQNISHDGEIQTIAATQGRLPEALVKERPEIEFATSVVPFSWFDGEGIITSGNSKITARPQFIGTNYFDIFSCPFIEGDKNAVFNDKYNIAISEELANKIFHTTQHIVGKTIIWNHDQFNGSYQVTGIFKNQPANATDQFDVLLNFALFIEKRTGLEDWGNSDPCTFVLLKPGVAIEQVNGKIKNFLQLKMKDTKNTLFLQRYSEKYLYNNYENGMVAGGRIEYVRLFSIIALFILIIACINFMNLSTAKASRRMKEVGIKKAIGAGRQGLVFQFIAESLSIAFLSLLTALLLVLLLLPGFNEITGKQLSLGFDSRLLLSLLALTIFAGLIAGSYPALYLSGFKPAVVLKGKLKGSVGELWARKGLVVFQFTLSVILIVAVVVVYKQIMYVQTKNLGFNRENIIHFNMQIEGENTDAFFAKGGPLEKKVEAYMQEVKNIPGIISAANIGGHNLTGGHGEFGGMDWKEGEEDKKMGFSNLEVGYDFIETLEIKMAEGRSYSRAYANEDSKIIFNEEAIKRMGLKDPIGKKVRFWGMEKEIIGVAKDFHFESLYKKVNPCVIQLEPRVNAIIVRIARDKQADVIKRLQKFHQSHNPGLPFDYKFVDQDYQALYVAEQRVATLSKYFASVAIIISCLGLFGLAVFTAQRTRKEIGIRKMLGSGELSIVRLLSGEFLQMIIIAIVIALPLSYMVVKNWLQHFEYAIALQWWFFAGAGFVTLVIGWLAVAAQTFNAAKINPVKTLREE